MADEKSYTEEEHIAILSDRIARETSELTAERDRATAAVTELENKLDLAETAKVAAEQRATAAEQALEDFKAQVAEEREAAARKDERLSKVREAASHLDEEFWDEKRVSRIVAMDDEQFAGYVADLQAIGSAAPKSTALPRETAMVGADAKGHTESSNARSVLLGRYAPERKG